MSKRYRLIELLSDGSFSSGTRLAEELGVSRAAVWKHMKALPELGLEVDAVRGRGYRLRTPLQLLRAGEIRRALPDHAARRLDAIEVLQCVDSTSEQLRRKLDQLLPGRGRACLAEQQSAGRGRRGRNWVSPYGSGLFLSLAWYIDRPGLSVSGLSLAVAVAVLRGLAGCGVEGLGLKWPNDIFLEGRKLGGILLDLSGESGGAWRIVTGVGVNVRLPPQAAAAIDQPWSDLAGAGLDVDRNRLAGAVLGALVAGIDGFTRSGLKGFAGDWARYDLIAGRRVELHQGDRMISGIARGIDEDGALLIEHDGVTERYHAGEVSVRPAG